jgi:hypothetical protein
MTQSVTWISLHHRRCATWPCHHELTALARVSLHHRRCATWSNHVRVATVRPQHDRVSASRKLYEGGICTFPLHASTEVWFRLHLCLVTQIHICKLAFMIYGSIYCDDFLIVFLAYINIWDLLLLARLILSLLLWSFNLRFRIIVKHAHVNVFESRRYPVLWTMC